MAPKSHKRLPKGVSSNTDKQCKIEHFFKKGATNSSFDRQNVESVEVKRPRTSDSPVKVHKRKRNPLNDSEEVESSYLTAQTCRDTQSESCNPRGDSDQSGRYLKSRLSLKKRRTRNEKQTEKLPKNGIEIIDISSENGIKDCLSNSLDSENQTESSARLKTLPSLVNNSCIETSDNQLVLTSDQTEVAPLTKPALQHAPVFGVNNKVDGELSDNSIHLLSGIQNIPSSQSKTNDTNSSCKLNLTNATEKSLSSAIVDGCTADFTSDDISGELKTPKDASKSLQAGMDDKPSELKTSKDSKKSLQAGEEMDDKSSELKTSKDSRRSLQAGEEMDDKPSERKTSKDSRKLLSSGNGMDDKPSELKTSKDSRKFVQAGDGMDDKQQQQLNLPDFEKQGSSNSFNNDSSLLKEIEIAEDICKSDEFFDEGTGSQPEEMDADGDGDVQFRVPYYLENFVAMMTQVLKDEHYKCLFNDADMKVVEKFKKLSEVGQKLYVRMFSRKLMWRMQSKIKYSEIAEDLSEFIKELIEAGLAHSEQDLTQLDETLHLLSATDLRTVAKSFYHNCSNQTKVQIVELLLKHCKQKSVRSLFQPNGSNTVEKSMMNRSKKLLGSCFKLVESQRSVFIRMLTLFSLCVNSLEEETSGAISAQLFQMLQVNIGRVVFPTYKIHKEAKIFRSRDDLIRYGDAVQMESEIFSKMEKKDLSGAYEVYLSAKLLYDENKKDKKLKKWDMKLPLFLRHCTTGYICARLLYQGVELLQRQKNYKEAVVILEELLSQDTYACTDRGRWYDRLALNLDQHLKSPGKALDVIEKSLKDSWVSVGHRYSLYLRAEKICKDTKSRWHKRLLKLEHVPVVEAPKVFITGKTLDCGLPGVRYQFITSNHDTTNGTSSEDVIMCSVEVLVLNHYKSNGYSQGIHAEGSVVLFLFTLLFWEILYMDIPDVFINPFQAAPLDLASVDFYLNRKELIDARLQYISTASEQELNDDITKVWQDNYGCILPAGNWEMFNSVTELQGLVSCMEGTILAGIFSRYAKNPRHTRSGFPDLTLWNVNTKKFKISEVKGPGDRLSTKQMLWLDHLIKLGVDAEVTHIKPVGTKKLQPLLE